MDRMLSEMGGRFGRPLSLAAQTLLATSAQTIVASSGRALVLLWIGLQVGAHQAFVAVLGNFSDSVRWRWTILFVSLRPRLGYPL